jgi:signal transduction histidine kinase
LLRQLPGEIAKLAAKNDSAARLKVSGEGPVSHIASAINQLQARSKKREGRLLEVADLFQQTFWVLDAKCKRVTYLNGAGGFPSEPGAWVAAADPHDQPVVRAMLEKQRHHEAGQSEFRMQRPDGTVRWIWCRYFPVAGARGTVKKTVGVFEDITDQKEAEQILSISQTELHNVIELRQSQKLQSVGELMGGIAHEINTPIQFVGHNLEFLQEWLPRLDALLKAAVTQQDEDSDLAHLHLELPKALQQMQDGVDRVSKLAKTLKEYSREQKDQGRKSANLNHAVESTLLIARNAMKYVADVETTYGALPLVNCHLGDIQQVLLDLLVHAAHAIEEVTSKTKKRGLIRVETRPAGDWVAISISDTGKALSAEARQNIFERPVDDQVRGLALAYAIVTEEHGGTMICSSEPGKGNTFSIRLPVLGRSASSVFAAGTG